MTSIDPQVAEVLDRYPEAVRAGLERLRALIVETAAETRDAGELVETLKWGQPSYLTIRPKSGTTIRIDRDTSGTGDIALFVNCQSTLVSDWRSLFPDLVYGGDRSVHFSLNEPLPEDALRKMIAMAMTYHSAKRGKAQG